MASQPPVAEPPIRYRSRTGLKPYDPTRPATFLFSAPEGRHDRIKLKVRVSVAMPSNEWTNYPELIDNRTGPGWDILRVERQDERWIKFKTFDPWLFNLHGSLRWNAAWHRATGTLDLEINPTRFLAYQEQPYSSALGNRPWDQVLYRGAERRIELQRVTLDAGDNILPGIEHLGGSMFNRRSESWRRSLEYYLAHVESACRYALAPEGSFATLEECELASVSQCECYWELQTSNAPLVLRALSIAVRSSDPIVELHSIVGADTNASWLSLKLTNDIRLQVYAKCMDRLRFEVKYLKGISQELQRTDRPTSGPILQKLMDIRVGAAERVERFWEDYRQRLSSVSAQVQMIDFIGQFNAVTPLGARAELLTLLAANRAVVAMEEGGEALSREMCEALRSAGVLERTRHRQRGRVYRIARKYRAIFQQMFGGDHIVT